MERAAGFVLFGEHAGHRKYLIVKNRRGGHWGFPKGHIEPGEDPLAAARREVAEEVGIWDLSPVPGFVERISYSFNRGGKQVNKEVVLFLGQAQKEGEALGEIEDMHWLPYPEALGRITYEEQREVLRRAERRLGGGF